VPAGSDPDFATLAAACARLGVELTPAGHAALARYAALLREWNERINLISRRDSTRVLTYHVIDSLAASPLLPDRSRVCDLGAGAGLPGIPLAIVRPDLDVVLLESSRKRGLFLQAAIDGLGLGNCRLAAGRAEALPPLDCDIVVARLTGPVFDTITWAVRHLRAGGRVILYKTPATDDDQRRMERTRAKLRLSVPSVLDVQLPLAGITRRFLSLTRQP
jgi:16S rRNA (guanine527-N7)-methyltransferase